MRFDWRRKRKGIREVGEVGEGGGGRRGEGGGMGEERRGEERRQVGGA